MTSVRAKRSRSEERVPVALPVSLDRGTGITRNISASGVFFETEVNYGPASEISFSIELDGPAGRMMLKSQGQVLRIEDRGAKVGVATKIIESRLEMVNDLNAGYE